MSFRKIDDVSNFLPFSSWMIWKQLQFHVTVFVSTFAKYLSTERLQNLTGHQFGEGSSVGLPF